ncbi:MAG: hypothetical protein PUK86_11230 [bacterium]|nr:hypothetical protein [bacterium]
MRRHASLVDRADRPGENPGREARARQGAPALCVRHARLSGLPRGSRQRRASRRAALREARPPARVRPVAEGRALFPAPRAGRNAQAAGAFAGSGAL